VSNSGRKAAHRDHSHGHGPYQAASSIRGRHSSTHRHRAHHRRRRRKQLHTFVFAASTLLSPHSAKPAKAKITTSATYRAVPAEVIHEAAALRPDDNKFEPIVQEAAQRHGLDPDLIRAVMRFESAYDPSAVSPAGAVGLMQLTPDVAAELGVEDLFDPRQNIMAGARYLRELLDRHHGQVDLALASYNAGPAAVDRYHAVPPFPETRRYVKNITAFLQRSRSTGGKS
jgi:soluble lytic murein transglycosylase-like protein